VPKLRIIHRSSVLKGRELTLEDPVIRLGRDLSCQVLFDENADRTVSRIHAEIRWEGATPVLHPSAGRVTLVNQQRAQGPTVLSSGDLVTLAAPEGPSVEVLFGEAASMASNEAKTVMEAIPPELRWGPPGEKKLKPPPPPTAAPPPRPPDLPMPSGNPNQGTQIMSLVEAVGQVPAPESHPEVARSRRTFMGTAVIGVVVLVVAALAAGLYLRHQRQQRVQAAVARVEALLEAAQASGVAPEVSEEDLKLLQEEADANHPLPAKIDVKALVQAHEKRVHHAQKQPHAPPPSGATSASGAVAANPGGLDVPVPPPEGATGDGFDLPPGIDAIPAQGSVLTTFAALQRARIAKLSFGKGHDGPSAERAKKLLADVKAAEAAYDAAVAALPPRSNAPADVAIRHTARALGECDAVIPALFMGGVRKAIDNLKNDAEKRDALVAALKRAVDFRYTPTITAALADQGLPVELFFIPEQMSGFDSELFFPPGPAGVTRGMWQITNSAAEAMQIHIGKNATDPSDERLEYQKEIRKVAKALRPLFLHDAAGSTLLLMATYDHGSSALLSAVRHQANLNPDDEDPATVNFWHVFSAGGLSENVKQQAFQYFAVVTVATSPTVFGFQFAPPLEHVALEQSE
jgi:hypothetical protein